MWSDAFAQGTAAAPAAASNPMMAMLVQYFPIIMMGAVVYFMMIRPAQQKQKKMEETLKNQKKGDRVLTSAGIMGTIVGIDDSKAVLKIADDVKVEFIKGAITQVLVAEAK